MADIIKNPLQQFLAENSGKANLPDHLKTATPVVAAPSRAAAPAVVSPTSKSIASAGGEMNILYGETKRVFSLEADDPSLYTVNLATNYGITPTTLSVPEFQVNVPMYSGTVGGLINRSPIYGIVNYGIGGYNVSALVDFCGSFSVVANRISVDAIYPARTAAGAFTDQARVTGFVAKGGVSRNARCTMSFLCGGDTADFPILPMTKRFMPLRNGRDFDHVERLIIRVLSGGFPNLHVVWCGANVPWEWIEAPQIPSFFNLTQIIAGGDPGWGVVGDESPVVVIYEMEL